MWKWPSHRLPLPHANKMPLLIQHPTSQSILHFKKRKSSTMNCNGIRKLLFVSRDLLIQHTSHWFIHINITFISALIYVARLMVCISNFSQKPDYFGRLYMCPRVAQCYVLILTIHFEGCCLDRYTLIYILIYGNLTPTRLFYTSCSYIS